MTARFQQLFLAALSIWFTLAAPALHAEIKTHPLFTDNMILQRDVKAPVSGTTDKPDQVTVKFGDQTVTATPEGGKWKAELAPLKAAAEPRDLVISQGDQTLTHKNVLVGDIWLCGGQSNMLWAVNQSTGQDEAISSARNPKIRLFTVSREEKPEPLSGLASEKWAEAGPETIAEFTAVGYYFGRDLQKAVNVPIGLISSNTGGTTAELWTSQEAIESNPEIKDMYAPQGRYHLYNAMIAPLAPFGIRGAIWYQGEANADRPYNYRHVLSAMIKSWRDTFGQGDFPFLIVELAPFMDIVKEPVDQNWAVLRESQQWVAKNVPNAATVSIVDVGDEKNIHPPQKQVVGERLARVARAMVYGEKIVPAGPTFENVSIQGNKAVIAFKNVGGGLVVEKGELTGFTLAGEDKKFYNASARIEGDTIVVTSDQVAAPAAVRYGWANYPVMNLWNKAGLPAHPFRTDAWEVIDQNIK